METVRYKEDMAPWGNLGLSHWSADVSATSVVEAGGFQPLT